MPIIKHVNKYFCWERLGSVAFIFYCLATVFMIFFSTSAIQQWPYPWNHVSILTACVLPLFIVFVWKIPTLLKEKKLEKQYIFILIIIILGALNIVFSEDRPTTLKVMVLFLISGIGIFATSSNLLSTESRKTIFLWLCWACLCTLFIYGTLEYINRKPINLLSYNPIPASSLLILLFVGPILLFPSSSWWLRFVQLLTIVYGIAVIIMIGSRGGVLGALVMAFLCGILLPGRKFWIIPLIALILVGTGYQMRNQLPQSFAKNLITHRNTLVRLENFPFAAHVFFQKPLFGTGLHAPLVEYLKDYRTKVVKSPEYSIYLRYKKTLENIVLCGFVEMGSLFTLTYVALIIYLLRNMFHHIRNKPEKRLKAVLLLILLAGFFIHSMTFDSLIYPHLNWLFHSYLGLMANLNEI